MKHREYKQVMQTLKHNSIEAAIKASEACWDKFPSKLKKEFNACSREAVMPYHVYCDGKRQLKAKESALKDSCKQTTSRLEHETCIGRPFAET